MKIDRIVNEAVKEYNKYRGAVAKARILKIDGAELALEISGKLCYTCGFTDYLEDFVYELERVTDEYKATLEKYEQVEDDKFIVKYRIEKTRS